MTKLKADSSAASYARHLLNVAHRLTHLRTRHRADVVTIESGPIDDPVAHARLKRVGVHLWVLEIADHRGRWESAPVRATLEATLAALVSDFGWVLTYIDDHDPLRTSDPEH
jgi:hypothetical protein